MFSDVLAVTTCLLLSLLSVSADHKPVTSCLLLPLLLVSADHKPVTSCLLLPLLSVSADHKLKMNTVSKQVEERGNKLEFLDAAKKHLEVRV